MIKKTTTIIIVTIFLLTSNTITNANNCTNEDQNKKDIKITNTYMNENEFTIEITNNEKTTQNIIVEIYKNWPQNENDKTERIRAEEIQIPAGDTKETTIKLPYHAIFTIQYIIFIGNQEHLINKPEKRYDEKWDNYIFWNYYIGWMYQPDQPYLDLNITIKNTGQNKPMQVNINLTNNEDKDLELLFLTGEIYDFKIYKIIDDTEQPVILNYKWSDHQEKNNEPTSLSLKAGETYHFPTLQWNKINNDEEDVTEGKYFIDGILNEYTSEEKNYPGTHDPYPPIFDMPRTTYKNKNNQGLLPITKQKHRIILNSLSKLLERFIPSIQKYPLFIVQNQN